MLCGFMTAQTVTQIEHVIADVFEILVIVLDILTVKSASISFLV
ncbi:hypothetical protein [Bacillus amyloliquefaciens]|nr:hypothetical protein [Bacillus amyloliquefaciens]MEC1012947.1 hypothetical protein [Bacillus amyloliquefaciens]